MQHNYDTIVRRTNVSLSFSLITLEIKVFCNDAILPSVAFSVFSELSKYFVRIPCGYSLPGGSHVLKINTLENER